MSIEHTQYLSKLSQDEINIVLKKWPNPLTPLACMLGGGAIAGYALMAHNKGEVSLEALIGSLSAFILLTLGSSVFNLVKLGKAKKALSVIAEKNAMPTKEVFKEFRSNLKHLKKI